MPAHIDPRFLPAWVRAELEATGEALSLDVHAARAVQVGLDDDEAELDAAGQIAESKGWLDALERAAGELWLTEVREARGASDRLERAGQGVVAWLKPAPGAVARLERLARELQARPEASVAELEPVLGGSPGCSVR